MRPPFSLRAAQSGLEMADDLLEAILGMGSSHEPPPPLSSRLDPQLPSSDRKHS